MRYIYSGYDGDIRCFVYNSFYLNAVGLYNGKYFVEEEVTDLKVKLPTGDSVRYLNANLSTNYMELEKYYQCLSNNKVRLCIYSYILLTLMLLLATLAYTKCHSM